MVLAAAARTTAPCGDRRLRNRVSAPTPVRPQSAGSSASAVANARAARPGSFTRASQVRRIRRALPARSPSGASRRASAACGSTIAAVPSAVPIHSTRGGPIAERRRSHGRRARTALTPQRARSARSRAAAARRRPRPKNQTVMWRFAGGIQRALNRVVTLAQPRSSRCRRTRPRLSPTSLICATPSQPLSKIADRLQVGRTHRASSPRLTPDAVAAAAREQSPSARDHVERGLRRVELDLRAVAEQRGRAHPRRRGRHQHGDARPCPPASAACRRRVPRCR